MATTSVNKNKGFADFFEDGEGAGLVWFGLVSGILFHLEWGTLNINMVLLSSQTLPAKWDCT